jgi:hypothetical protein
MSLREPDQPDAVSVSDLDNSSICTPTTTADNVTGDLAEDPSSPDWVVSDGSTVIKSASYSPHLAVVDPACGRAWKLKDGSGFETAFRISSYAMGGTEDLSARQSSRMVGDTLLLLQCQSGVISCKCWIGGLFVP